MTEHSEPSRGPSRRTLQICMAAFLVVAAAIILPQTVFAQAPATPRPQPAMAPAGDRAGATNCTGSMVINLADGLKNGPADKTIQATISSDTDSCVNPNGGTKVDITGDQVTVVGNCDSAFVAATNLTAKWDDGRQTVFSIGGNLTRAAANTPDWTVNGVGRTTAASAEDPNFTGSSTGTATRVADGSGTDFCNNTGVKKISVTINATGTQAP